MLKCSDDSLYTSSSSEDKDSFLRRHNNGNGEPYTKGRLPVTHYWEYNGLNDKWVASSMVHAVRRLYKYQKDKLFEGNNEILKDVLSKGLINGPKRAKNYKRYLEARGSLTKNGAGHKI